MSLDLSDTGKSYGQTLDFLIFYRAPEPFDKDIVAPGSLGHKFTYRDCADFPSHFSYW